MSEAASAWQRRIADRSVQVGIIGLGYVGLPLALLFAEAGVRVLGFDIDKAKVDALDDGRSYIQRIPDAEILSAKKNGLRATKTIAELKACDAVLICVPTPLAHDQTPDTSFITDTVKALAPHVRAGQLIVLESTTWPGTTRELVVPGLEQGSGLRVQGPEGEFPSAAKAGAFSEEFTDGLKPIPFKAEVDSYAVLNDDKHAAGPSATLRDDRKEKGLLVAFSPEREDPGNTEVPRRAVPKVVGGISKEAAEAAAALYEAIFDRAVVVSSTEAAEMTKLLENIYRGVNIALVNELKQLCVAMGIDIWEVIDAAKTKPFGFQAFYPGPGIGGHCIPVDPFYLSWRAQQFGQPTRFIELAGIVNQSMPIYVLRTIESALERVGKTLRGASVLLLGVAYKRDIDDLRESPALVLYSQLEGAGAKVAYNDPYFAEVGHGRHYAVNQKSTPLDRVGEFDCVVLVTDHSAYEVAKLVEASQLFVDTRNSTRGLVDPKIVRC